MTKQLERSALGRSGHLGALYDFRTDSFQGDNIFNQKIGKDEIYSTVQGNTVVELVLSDSLEDKFHHLNIEAELSVSILSGLIKVSGSGKYLEEKRATAKSSAMSLIYKVTTKTEEIYLRQLKKIVDLDSLNTSEATHVLTSVDWGAVCTVTAEYTFSDQKEKKEIEGSLEAELNKLKGVLDVSGSVEVDFKNKEQGRNEKFKFFSKCDVGNIAEDLPVTFQEAVQQAKSLPNLVKETNGGKGVPLKFMFTPLATVKKWFQQDVDWFGWSLNIFSLGHKQETTPDVIFKSIKEESLKKVVIVAQNFSEARQNLNDLHDSFKKGRSCIPDGEMHAVTRLVTEFSSEEAKFRDNLQDILRGIRSGIKDVSEIDKFISQLEASKFSPIKMEEEMTKRVGNLNKIEIVERMEKEGVKYFGKIGNIDYNAKRELYIIYMEDIREYDTSHAFFWKLQRTHTRKEQDVLFCIVDLEVNPQAQKYKERYNNKIVHYVEGKMESDDIMSKYGRDMDVCLSKFIDGQFCSTLPHNRAKVILRCPRSFSGETQCSGDPKQWLCFSCKEPLWYGVKTKFLYCEKCKQKCTPNATLYRCNDDSHGFDFLEYKKDYLEDELLQLRESKNLNILILGETGVGKSTWINAFANYLYFDTLSEAIDSSKATPVVAIPSKFTITEGDDTKEIIIGEQDDNEKHDIGVSSTQGTKTYPFPLGEYIVNLIDTPGIGDTRGSKKDDENMDNILSHISHYEELHGILVLLKPNNAKLGIVFRHCIQQLLAHLHKDAAMNISFVFTNTRSTFYQPGETLPPLRKLLKDKEMPIEAMQANMFCYDNEAFRFLACIINGVIFSSDVTEIYETSWKKASEETKRLLSHISKSRPHAVMNTITLNDSRRIIVELSRPLQEFAEVIKKNIRNIENTQREADALGEEAQSFYENLKFEGITLEQHDLEYPRTVCTDKACVKYVPVGKDQIKQPNYVQHCHKQCRLGGSVSPEVIGDVKLQGCAAMSNNVCKECGHHYTLHMHRTYDLHQVKTEFISDEVQAQLDGAKNKKQRAEANKKCLENLVLEFREEKEEIRKIGADFAAFLNTFAIIPFNDAMGAYIDKQIKEEEEKPQNKEQRKIVEDLIKEKDAYEEQKNIIEKALAELRDSDEGKEKAAKTIKELQARAFKLKHFGADVKKVFDKINSKKTEISSFQYGKTPPPPKSRGYFVRGRDWLKDKLWNSGDSRTGNWQIVPYK